MSTIQKAVFLSPRHFVRIVGWNAVLNPFSRMRRAIEQGTDDPAMRRRAMWSVACTDALVGRGIAVGLVVTQVAMLSTIFLHACGLWNGANLDTLICSAMVGLVPMIIGSIQQIRWDVRFHRTALPLLLSPTGQRDIDALIGQFSGDCFDVEEILRRSGFGDGDLLRLKTAMEAVAGATKAFSKLGDAGLVASIELGEEVRALLARAGTLLPAPQAQGGPEHASTMDSLAGLGLEPRRVFCER